MAAGAIDFLVRRDDLRRTRFAGAADPGDIDLGPGEILLAVDRFGFSANNITYAVLGDAMRYWEFFPAPDGWGRIPVWGFGDVVRSHRDGLAAGERVFGYLPMSTHVVVFADQVSDAGFVDGFPHRAELPPVYQRYSRTAADPGYQREQEDALALWRPLFMTSFGAADFLVESGRVEGGAIVISSASSKTALGTAFVLSRDRSSEYELIALTSPHNLAFCERVGYCDRVLAYDDLDSLRRDAPTTFVDFAGDESLLRRLRAHLGESLRSTTIIGATHWEERAPGRPLAAPDTTFFFLPPWLEKRRSDWGRGEFARRYGDVWRAFLASTESWLTIVRSEGPDAVEAVYRELLDGRARPDVGHILSLSS